MFLRTQASIAALALLTLPSCRERQGGETAETASPFVEKSVGRPPSANQDAPNSACYYKVKKDNEGISGIEILPRFPELNYTVSFYSNSQGQGNPIFEKTFPYNVPAAIRSEFVKVDLPDGLKAHSFKITQHHEQGARSDSLN